MPVQKTFTLIPQAPTTAAADSPPIRPMTSKQVRKAYKTANRAPRLSRAEQLRQDRAEQERIRKELDRERAAAKARVARERKRDKDVAERDEKRRRREPLVDVRASQDTIARFVRGNGSGRKREGGGKSVDEPRPDVAEAEGVEVRPCLGQLDAEGSRSEDAGKMGLKPLADNPELDLIPEEDDVELEMLEKITAAASNIPSPPKPQNPPRTNKVGFETHDDGYYDRPKKPRKSTPYEEDPGLGSLPPSKELQPVPRRTATHPECPLAPSPPRQDPPLSTQAILFNLDDYFPSSSQQARELDDELDMAAASSPPQQRQTPIPQQPRVSPPRPSPVLQPEQVSRHEGACQGAASPPPPSRRFFTSSGSHELMSLALHRSRRSAALEELHQKERTRAEAGSTVGRVRPSAKKESLRGAKPVVTTGAADTRRHRTAAPGRPLAAKSTTAHDNPLRQPSRNPKQGLDVTATGPSDTVHRHMQGGSSVVEPAGTSNEPMKRTDPSKLDEARPTCTTHHLPPGSIPPGGPAKHAAEAAALDAYKENLAPPIASQETEYGGDWMDQAALELVI